MEWISATHQAAIAQLGEHQTEDLKVPGSIPGLGIAPRPWAPPGHLPFMVHMDHECILWHWGDLWGALLCLCPRISIEWIPASHQAAIAQLGERQTEDLKVPSSILGLGMFPPAPAPRVGLGGRDFSFRA